jgi:hypothetical protein
MKNTENINSINVHHVEKLLLYQLAGLGEKRPYSIVLKI